MNLYLVFLVFLFSQVVGAKGKKIPPLLRR